jgi:hypothetical protein
MDIDGLIYTPYMEQYYMLSELMVNRIEEIGNDRFVYFEVICKRQYDLEYVKDKSKY